MFRCVSYYLGVFGTLWLRYKTQCKTAQSGEKVRATKLRRNFVATNAPDPPHRTLNSCFGVFCTIWMNLGPFGCITKFTAKRAKLVQKFVPRSRVGIFLKNAHDPPHWTLNSYFGVFCTNWMHLGPFGCLTKLSAKRAELAQKFLARSRVIIFRNEQTRLIPLGPKLMFLCVSYYLGAFGTVWLPYKTWCKTSRSGAKVRAMKSCRNFSQ